MRLVDRLYDWLSQGPTPDCDRIFAAALVHAEPAWAERIVRILLRRGHEASWASLIGRYGDLTPEIHQELHQRGDLMRAGIAQAIRSSTPETRANALRALEQQPDARMAYLLPEALRDPAPKVRALGSQVLRTMADTFLEQLPPPADADEDTRQAYQGERYQLVLAVEEALRAFDLHTRIEVLETCLWFARDLGEALWKKLTSRRSRAGVVVSEQLAGWNHPRLAHFLVSSLRRPAWRELASRVLRTWKTVPQVAALLGENELLDDPRVRQHLRNVRSPLWFTKIDRGLTDLTPNLRPLAPRWTCHAGYRGSEKTALLSRWVQASDPRIHHAAVYALAEIDDAGARALLKQVAKSDSPLASFAQWCVMSLHTDTLRSAKSSGTAGPGPAPYRGAVEAPAQYAEADTDCTMLWQACRRTPPSQRGELIAVLREHTDLWRPRLRSYLQSPDPRDRILVLQIISTGQLASQFRHDLEPLLSDPVEGIRELTQMLVRKLPRQPSPTRPVLAMPPHRGPRRGEEAHDEVRRELRTALERLSTGAAQPTDAELINRVRDLLRELYTEQRQEVSAGSVREENS